MNNKILINIYDFYFDKFYFINIVNIFYLIYLSILKLKKINFKFLYVKLKKKFLINNLYILKIK